MRGGRWIESFVALLLPMLLGFCDGARSETMRDETDDPGIGGPVPGRLVVVGGGLDSDTHEVWSAVARGLDGSGPLCVLPTASSDPRESMVSAVERFSQEVGPGTVRGIYLTTENAGEADDPAMARDLGACSGYWFTGGSQSRIADVFRPDERNTPSFDAVWSRYMDGAVVAGSSAGAAMMPDPMISGGGSGEALRDGLEEGEDDAGVDVRFGMGFFRHGFVDQHFLARGRWGRLVTATLESPGFDVGFGIDENTALLVEGTTARVIGESGVVLVDARNATGSREGGEVHGVVLQLAGTGDVVDLATLDVARPGDKSDPGPRPDLDVPEDPFERWAFLQLLDAFARTDVPSVTMTAEGYDLVLEKGAGFSVAAYEEMGVEETPSGLSAGPFVLSIRRGS